MASPRPTKFNIPYPLRIDTSVGKHMTTTSQAQAIRQPMQDTLPRQSVQTVSLHRLDGTSYPISPKTLKAEISRDMYIGQNTQDSRGIATYVPRHQLSLPILNTKKENSRSSYRRELGANVKTCPHGNQGRCNTCTQTQMANSRASGDSDGAQQHRSVSDGSTSTLVNSDTSIAAASMAPSASKRACHRCGRAKKPTVSTERSRQFMSDDSVLIPPPTFHIASQYIASTDNQNRTSTVPTGVPRRKPVPSYVRVHEGANGMINIDITPPTAVTEQPQSNALVTVTRERSPLLNIHKNETVANPRRSTSLSSIASSIRRSLSGRRDKSGDTFRSSSPENRSEAGATRLISMISKAIRGNVSEDYSKIGENVETERRPASPFSFVGSSDKNSFELDAIQTSHKDLNSTWKEMESQPVELVSASSDPFADPIPEPVRRPEHLRLRSDAMKRLEIPLLLEENSALLTGSNQPAELSRFKSLRNGVQRAGSVTRSTSLKRLNSLKNAPQLWYRSDMALEGAAISAY